MKVLALVVMCLFAGLLFYAEADMGKYGDTKSAPSMHVSPYYIQKSMKETKTPNIVSAVLADYRGYDTLGETTVIFTAGLVCMMLLAKGMSRDT